MWSIAHGAKELPLSEEEVLKAFDTRKCSKADGKNGLPPELVKHVGTVFAEHIQELFKAVWEDGRVPKEWVNAVIVTIPKKGDLSDCDDGRVISLLDFTGKVFAHILQHCLWAVADGELHGGIASVAFIKDVGALTWPVEKVTEHE